jgi:hypothetical protein
MNAEQADYLAKNKFMQKYFDDANRLARGIQGEDMTDEQFDRVYDKVQHDLKKFEKEKPYEIGLTSRPGKPDSDIAMYDFMRVLNWLASGDPIISAYGTVFKNHSVQVNYSGRMLTSLGDMRAKYKKVMFGFKKGTTEYNNGDRYQKIYKEQGNSFYGALGTPVFQFYHKHLGPSVTYQGVVLTTTAMQSIESFMVGNNPFLNFSQLVRYISNCLEENSEFTVPTTELEEISADKLAEYLLDKCKFKITDSQYELFGSILEPLGATERKLIFFKNNLFEFLNLESILDITAGCISEEFTNYEKPPEDIKENVDMFTALLMQYVYYPHLLEDRFTRMMDMERSSALLADTDSCFVHIHPFYEHIEKHFDLGAPSHDKTIYVSSIITKVLGDVLADSMSLITKNLNIPEEERRHILLKNEFLYSRLIMTPVKKTYFGSVILQEGHRLDPPDFDMKGLQLKKTTTNRVTREFFLPLLRTEIAEADNIDLRSFVGKYIEYEEQINNGIVEERSNTFSLPKTYKNAKAFAAPFTQMAFRGGLVWNALYPDSSHQSHSKVFCIKLLPQKVEEFQELFESIPESYFEDIDIDHAFNTIAEVVYGNPEMAKYEFDTITLPMNRPRIPKWLIPFINIDGMVHANMSAAFQILHSIGVNTVEYNANVHMTSLLKI